MMDLYELCQKIGATHLVHWKGPAKVEDDFSVWIWEKDQWVPIKEDAEIVPISDVADISSHLENGWIAGHVQLLGGKWLIVDEVLYLKNGGWLRVYSPPIKEPVVLGRADLFEKETGLSDICRKPTAQMVMKNGQLVRNHERYYHYELMPSWYLNGVFLSRTQQHTIGEALRHFMRKSGDMVVEDDGYRFWKQVDWAVHQLTGKEHSVPWHAPLPSVMSGSPHKDFLMRLNAHLSQCGLFAIELPRGMYDQINNMEITLAEYPLRQPETSVYIHDVSSGVKNIRSILSVNISPTDHFGNFQVAAVSRRYIIVYNQSGVDHDYYIQ
jgi:hypothetical protein